MKGLARQSATRHYKISDTWISQYSRDTTRYFDIRDVANSTVANPCQYLQDLVNLNVITSAQIEREAARASFIVASIIIGRAIDGGALALLNARLEGDAYADQHRLAPTTEYFLTVQRIYAFNTNARDIIIYGV